jgi:hypothetical protein
MAARTGRNTKWQSAQARTTACEELLLGGQHMDSEGYVPADYRVSFSYEVDGRLHTGRFRASSPQEVGETIEILYDRTHPNRNSLADAVSNPLIRLGAWIVGIGLAVLAIWLWGSQDWFSN